MVGAWQQVAGTVTRILNCRPETGKWTWDAIMNTQACSSDISSSNTILKPPQILPPTGEQAFKYLSLLGTYLLKLLHSTCWATWYQQLSLVPEELSAWREHVLVSMRVHVSDVLMKVSIPPLWHCLIPLKYGLSLDSIQSSCFSARLTFSRPFLCLGSSVLELQARMRLQPVFCGTGIWSLILILVHCAL